MHLLWEGLGDRVIGALLCISFGMMLYLVVFELIPHLKEENSNVLTAVGAIAGAAIIVISMLFE